MASTNRFAYLRETVRNHPVVIASGVATAGVLLGGFVAMQLLDPSPPRIESAAASQGTAEIKTTPKPVAETTGSAAASDSVTSGECEQQTWPYLSRVCMEEYRSKHRAPRVVSTDKLDKQTVEAIENKPEGTPDSAAQSEFAAPAAWAPAVASVAPIVPPATEAAPVAPEPSPAAEPQPSPPQSSPAVAAAQPAPAVASTDTKASPPAAAPLQTATQNEVKEKLVAKKAKRKPKSERKAPIKPEFDEDDGRAVAGASSDHRDEDRITDDRRDRQRRVVDRWIERDYDVPAEGGRGRRRVTVIQRGSGGSGGGLLGSLFGGFGGF